MSISLQAVIAEEAEGNTYPKFSFSVEAFLTNAELNPICPLLALFGAHHILHVSRIRVKGHFNPLNAKLNPICPLLALSGTDHILHVSR